MWPVAVTYAAIAGIGVAVVALGVEIAKWRSSAKILTRRHQVVRISAGVLLILLLGMVACGGAIDFEGNPLYFVFYWGACTALVLVLMILAFFDVRETLIAYAKRHMEITRGILEEEPRNKSEK